MLVVPLALPESTILLLKDQLLRMRAVADVLATRTSLDNLPATL